MVIQQILLAECQDSFQYQIYIAAVNLGQNIEVRTISLFIFTCIALLMMWNVGHRCRPNVDLHSKFDSHYSLSI